MDAETYVAQYGEEFRRLIVAALEFIRGKPWSSDDFDVDVYIAELISRASPEDP